MVTALTEKLAEIDDTIPELPVKDVVSPASHPECIMHAPLVHHMLTCLGNLGFPHLPGHPIQPGQNSLQ